MPEADILRNNITGTGLIWSSSLTWWTILKLVSFPFFMRKKNCKIQEWQKNKFTAQGAKDKVWSKFTLFTYILMIITRSKGITVNFSKGIAVTFSTLNAKISFSSVLTEVIKIAFFCSFTKQWEFVKVNNFRTREHFMFSFIKHCSFLWSKQSISRNFDTGLTSILTPNVGNQDL